METKERLAVAVDILRAIIDAIKELKEVPNGELYARLMPHLSYEDYTKAIDVIKKSGLVIEVGNVLKWNA